MIFEDVSVPRLQTNSQAWDGPSDGLFMVAEDIVRDAGKHVDPGTESGSTSLHGMARTPSAKAKTVQPYIYIHNTAVVCRYLKGFSCPH